ncbi:MAG TPA: hypothetical protein VI431_09670, partial [Candidatus Acidoferrum sp.]
LTDALVSTADGQPATYHRHRAETTVIAVDLSGSMTSPMEGRRKIEVVEQALMQLLLYKQRCFS